MTRANIPALDIVGAVEQNDDLLALDEFRCETGFGVIGRHIAARNTEVFTGAAREKAVQHLIGRQTHCAANVLEARALQGSLL